MTVLKTLVCCSDSKEGLAYADRIRTAVPDGDLCFWEDMALEIVTSDAAAFRCGNAWDPVPPAEIIGRFGVPASKTQDMIRNSKVPVPLEKPMIRVWCKGRDLLAEHYDLALLFGWYGEGRFGAYRDLAFALGMLLRDAGTEVWNSESYKRAWMSKISLMFLLAHDGCLVPDTLYAPDPAVALACLRPGRPYIVKDASGTHGQHNYLTDDSVRILEALKAKRCLVQGFVPNEYDLRVICFGCEAYLVMERARGDDSTHLNNTTKGGRACWRQEIPDKLRALSRRIADVSYSDMAGIDFVETKAADGSFDYWCLEVNVIPQLTSGFDVPAKMQALAGAVKDISLAVDSRNRVGRQAGSSLSTVRAWQARKHAVDPDKLPVPCRPDSGQMRFMERYRLTDEFRKAYGGYLLDHDLQGSEVQAALADARRFMKAQDVDVRRHRDLLIDLLYSRHVLGFTPMEYFVFGLADKSIAERLEFMSFEGCGMYNSTFNADAGDVIRLKDKYGTYRAMESYFKREMCLIDNEERRRDFIAFCGRHERFFVKPVDGRAGVNAGVMDARDYEDAGVLFNVLLERRRKTESDVLCEELVICDERMAAFHPQSVNSVRVCAYLKADGTTSLVFALLRTSRGDMVVDNAGPGWMVAGIDLDTGVICTDAGDSRGNIHEVHPDTGVRFKGFQIPGWNELKLLVAEITPLFPGVRLKYWDLALSRDKGWQVLEGNTNGVTNMLQFATKSGCRREMEARFEWDSNRKPAG